MLIKPPDDKTARIDDLSLLLAQAPARADSADLRRELSYLRQQRQAERLVQHEVDFYLGESPHWAVLHDLWLPCQGAAAHIGCLLISRFLEFCVCETVHPVDGLTISNAGAWTTYRRGRATPVPSLYDNAVTACQAVSEWLAQPAGALPPRMGFPLRPYCYGFVLVSKNCRIRRPTADVHGAGQVIKVDQLESALHLPLRLAGHSPALLFNLVSSKTLRQIATRLAAAHNPRLRDSVAIPGWTTTEDVPDESLRLGTRLP